MKTECAAGPIPRVAILLFTRRTRLAGWEIGISRFLSFFRPANWISLELGSVQHHPAQARETTTKIGHTWRDPDPRSGTLLLNEKVDHHRKPSSTARIAAGSARPSTLIRTSPGSSMWIEPQLEVTTSSGGRSASPKSIPLAPERLAKHRGGQS